MTKLLYANTHNRDMLYAVGIEVPDPFFLLDIDGTRHIFLDRREYGIFLEENKKVDLQVHLLDSYLESAQKIEDEGSLVYKLAYAILDSFGVINQEILVPNDFPIGMADYLRSKGINLVATASLFPERKIKSEDEVNKIREALRRTGKAFAKIEEILKASVIQNDMLLYQDEPLTSERLKSEAEQVLLAEDMLNTEGIIISCAEHAAIPHHRGAGAIHPHQTIVCDIFPRHRGSGYFADMTRTYVKGNPSEEIKKLYSAVLEAQENALNKAVAGMPGSALHQICVDTFLEKGYHVGDQGFVHGTGHGLGLDVHEAPRAGATSEDILEAGHVVTVEPGLYYPEVGGVRIEDVVVIRKSGVENLTNYHKNYIIP